MPPNRSKPASCLQLGVVEPTPYLDDPFVSHYLPSVPFRVPRQTPPCVHEGPCMTVYKVLSPIPKPGAIPGDTIALCAELGDWLIRRLPDGDRLVRRLAAGTFLPPECLQRVVGHGEPTRALGGPPSALWN